MENQLKELIAKRGSLWDAMQACAEDGFESAENREKYQRIESDLDAVDAEISATEAHMRRAASMVEQGVEAPQVEVPEDESRGVDYEDTFEQWVRRGVSSLNPEQRDALNARMQNHETRALGTVAGPAGGYTVPEGFWNQIVEARSAFGGLRQAPVTTLTTEAGNDIPVPTGDDDSANKGIYIGENTVNTEKDLTFDQKLLKAFTITTRIIRVPNELLQDSAFDISAYIARKFGERIGRGEATKFVLGTGLEQPEGLMVAAPVGYTVSGTNTFAYADFVHMVHSVDPAYRNGPNTGWLMGDSTVKTARLLTVSSTDSRPIWQPGLTVGEPNTILGYQYWVDQEIATVATGALVAAFGDMSAFWLRDVAGLQIRRLEERYAEYNQVGFIGYARNDSRLIDAGTNPIKTLKMG